MYNYCKTCCHDDGDIGFCDKCGYTYMLRKRGLPPTEYEAKLKPQTKADRIRAMTDEELAEFLEIIPHCGNPPTYTINGFCIDDGLRTKSQWLDWLRQEADDEN